MVESDRIVFTEPVTRPNRREELWESDSVWLYRDRPIRLYPTTETSFEEPERASGRLTVERLTEIVEAASLISEDEGMELLLRSEADGLLLLRRDRIGWFVACARPDAGQYKVAAELARFGRSVALKFEHDAQESEPAEESFESGNTSLIAGRVGFEDKLPPEGEETEILGDLDDDLRGDAERLASVAAAPSAVNLTGITWDEIVKNLNSLIEGTSGRFRMFAIKAWRQTSRLVPVTFDLDVGFSAHSRDELTLKEQHEISRIYRDWRETVETTSGERPPQLDAQPYWYSMADVKDEVQ